MIPTVRERGRGRVSDGERWFKMRRGKAIVKERKEVERERRRDEE